MKNGFTMIELVFAIVIIGILSAVAIPKFAANRDDAEISKAKSTLASVRVAIATERQKRVLKGDFSSIFSLKKNSTTIFDFFDNNDTEILQYPLIECTGTEQSCWKETTVGTTTTEGVYTYKMPVTGTVDFTLSNNKLTCDTSDDNCLLLSQ